MADVRLIDANAADVDRICCYHGGCCYLEDVQEWMNDQPTIDAVPVVHARWVRNDLGHAYCSKCYERLPFMHCYTEEPCSDYDEEWDEEIPETRYCPNCGARMDAKDMNVPTKDGGAE